MSGPVWCKKSNEPYDIVIEQNYGNSVRAITSVLQPFHLLLIALAGWLSRRQQSVLGYLIEENRVLKEQLEGQRLRFTDEQRIRLAVKAKVLGRRVLAELETLGEWRCQTYGQEILDLLSNKN